MNKDIESFYLEKFKENYSGFPIGEICPNDPPDFVVRGRNTLVGIEITQFFRTYPGERPLQERESIRRKIIDQAKSIYSNLGGSAAHVTVVFDMNFYCAKSEIIKIAEKLGRLVWQATSTNFGHQDLHQDQIQIDGIALIAIKRNISIIRWIAPLANFVPEISEQQIQEILTKKNNSAASYREKYDELWLIIVMDRFRASSFARISESIAQTLFVHDFDNAFLFFYDYENNQKPPIVLRRKEKE